MNKLNYVLMAFVIMVPALVHAEDWQPVSGLSLGGRVAYIVPNSGDTTSFGGAQLRIQGRVLGVEGSLDYRSQTSRGVKAQVWPVQATLMARLAPDSQVIPFFLGGAGLYYTTISYNDVSGNEQNKTSSRFGLHAGMGLEAFLNSSWSVDGTWRHIWIEKPASHNLSPQNKEYDDSGDMVTIGLNLHF